MDMSQQEKHILEMCEDTFSKRVTLLRLWQEIADNFYPERADFTFSRSMGEEFASHLTDSYPVMVRRELGNNITTMLRPSDTDWGSMTVQGLDRMSNASKRWLEWAWSMERQAMYMRHTSFTRSTKEADHDFATFGQAVIQTTKNSQQTGFLFRTHHLRDVAWMENENLEIDHIYVKRCLPSSTVVRLFKDVHPRVEELAKKEPFRDVHMRHIIVPTHAYEGQLSGNKNLAFVELWYDIENSHIMYKGRLRTKQYVIPRWQTVSGTQYAYSPATITALPDARLIQDMTAVLLEAGEKMIDPPLIAAEKALKSDVAAYAGGITWVDKDYEQDPLRPLYMDKHGVPYGVELTDRQKMQLKDMFYLNQIAGVPQLPKEMTAYEVQQHVANYVRQATPLFEPMEYEYNGGLCEEVFTQMLWSGGFGALESIPRELRSKDIEFKFRSPLRDAIGREKGARLMEVLGLMEPASAVEAGVRVQVDVIGAFRDALHGMGVPSSWMYDEDRGAANAEQLKQQIGMEHAVEMAERMGVAGQAAGRAGRELSNAAMG